MPQLQLAVGIGTGDLFALVVVACVWAIAMLLEWVAPASPSGGDAFVSTLAWEDPAAPEATASLVGVTASIVTDGAAAAETATPHIIAA
jgi:hypothetical protein